MTQTITKLYDRYDDASRAVAELEQSGISHSDISLIANNAEGKIETHAAADAGIGASAGATIGGVGGLLAGLGMLAIPGVGPLVAAGWLAATAAGAGAGALIGGTAGGIVGALQKEGVNEADANVYSEGVRRGGTLVSVRVPDEQLPQAQVILDRYAPVDPARRRESYVNSGWTKFDDQAPPYDASMIEEDRRSYTL